MILFDVLKQSAEKAPGAAALCQREQVVTYGRLLELSEGFARGLAGLGVSGGSRVALLLPNCLPFVVAYLGAGRAGACLVPMNVLYRPDEARYILEDSGAETLVTIEPFRPLVQAIRPHLPNLKHVIMADDTAVEGEINLHSLCSGSDVQCVPASEEDCAVILYTSGTTGRPKGAMLTHRNLIANATSCTSVLSVGPDDCFLSALPLFHSFAAMVFIVLPVMIGARIHLMERFMPQTTLSIMEQSGATLFGGVPSMFGLMLQMAAEVKPDLSALRTCVSGGAPLPPDVWHAFEAAFGTKLVEGYGLTEASPVVSINPPYGLCKAGSVGLPLPGVEVRMVDENMQDVPPGEIGELIVRGENVMCGYLNKPADTAQVIRDGWLLTGDLAKVDEDGYLYVVGRKKELIIVGGLNVYPGEVERVLVEHPAVLEAAVFGVPDEARGEAVRAAVVLRPDTTATERELQTFARDKLASYKVPRTIEIRDSLPKNALGKVMRHVLRDEAALC